MDSELGPEVRRRRIRSRALAAGSSVAALALVLVALPRVLRPSVPGDRIRVETVGRGAVTATIEAAGVVRPASERVLSSPIDARVLRIVRRAGALVRPGDEIVALDTSATRLDLERLDEQLAQKVAERRRTEIQLAKALETLRSRARSAALDREILDAKAAAQHRLAVEGLVSSEATREAEVAARKAEIDGEQLARDIESDRRDAAAQLEGLDHELRVLESARDDARRKLELASARADRAGVLTTVVADEGTTVRVGDVLARIADPHAFRVDASVSDVHAARLAAGQAVEVVADGATLPGTIATVEPAIADGVQHFWVDLGGGPHPALRNKLRVDVYVVVARHADTLRLARGPAFACGGRERVFVVKGGVARRTTVRFGLSGRDACEVLDGLAAGDRVIVSDMQDQADLDEIRVR